MIFDMILFNAVLDRLKKEDRWNRADNTKWLRMLKGNSKYTNPECLQFVCDRLLSGCITETGEIADFQLCEKFVVAMKEFVDVPFGDERSFERQKACHDILRATYGKVKVAAERSRQSIHANL